MNVIRIPTKFVRSIQRLSDRDRLSVFDSLLKIGKDETINLPDTAAWDTIQLIYWEWINMESRNWTKPTINHISESLGTNSPSDSVPRVEESRIEYSIVEENKIEENNAIALSDKSEVTTYWNQDITKMLDSLSKSVWCQTFKEAKKIQRWFWKHMLALLSKIGKEEFMERLKWVLSDPFKRKNSNSIKYLYGELKSYIWEGEGVEVKKQKVVSDIIF